MILSLLLVSHNRTMGQLGTVLQMTTNNDRNEFHGNNLGSFSIATR